MATNTMIGAWAVDGVRMPLQESGAKLPDQLIRSARPAKNIIACADATADARCGSLLDTNILLRRPMQLKSDYMSRSRGSSDRCLKLQSLVKRFNN